MIIKGNCLGKFRLHYSSYNIYLESFIGRHNAIYASNNSTEHEIQKIYTRFTFNSQKISTKTATKTKYQQQQPLNACKKIKENLCYTCAISQYLSTAQLKIPTHEIIWVFIRCTCRARTYRSFVLSNDFWQECI